MTVDKTVLQSAYLADLLSLRRGAALDRVMDAFRSGYAITDIYLDVFQESLYEIGRLWETNRIGVAEEHMGTAITQFIMANLYQYLEKSGVSRGRLVVTGIEGELHQVGANMISDILEADGWDVVFLGADVSPPDVIQSVRDHNADLLGISATMVMSLPSVIALVGLVRSEFGAKAPTIMLGGGAFTGLSKFPPELAGCLYGRDLADALRLTQALSGRKVFDQQEAS